MALATTTNRAYPIVDDAPTSYMDDVIIPALADLANLLDVDVQALITGKIATTTLDTDGTLAANDDAKIASQKATKTYANFVGAAAIAASQPLAARLTAIVASGIAASMFATNVLDTDATLSANDNARIASQSAVKSYVDNAITGVFWKPAADVATTGNITLSGEQTIDGVLTSASRVLVRAQTTASQNGLYLSGAGTWTRVAEADTGFEIWGATVMVKRGTVGANTQWTNTNTAQPTLGSTSITFAQISGAGTYSATGGVVLTGNQFSADTGTSGHKLPWLDGANTWSSTQTFSVTPQVGSDPIMTRGAAETITGAKTASGIWQFGSQAAQSNALLSNRGRVNGFEWGHPNTSGYSATLGMENGSGLPNIVFGGEGGTNNSTYRTRGLLASILRGDAAGGFVWGTVGNTNADNQSLVETMKLTSAAMLTITGAGSKFAATSNTSADPGYVFNTNGGRQDRIIATSGGLYMGVNVGASEKVFIMNTSGLLRASGYGAGTLVTDASGNITASSDERLKVMGRGFTRGIEDMLRMDSPRFYRWRKKTGMDQSEYVGFGAQGVRKGIREAVGKDPRGNLTLQDRPLIATHHNAIIALHKRIAKLERRLAA